MERQKRPIMSRFKMFAWKAFAVGIIGLAWYDQMVVPTGGGVA